jgi:hypothetical protein
MGMNVKGSILIQIVKTIKTDKSGIYDTYLTNKDREIISERVLSNIWYPFETYKHCLNAIFEIIAKNDLEVAKEWGRTSCQALADNIFAFLVEGRDPLSFFKKYKFIHQSFYDFGKLEIFVEGKNQAVYKLSDFDAQFLPLYYIIQGWLERGLELCGAKNIKCEFLTKAWEGHPSTSMRFTWT